MKADSLRTTGCLLYLHVVYLVVDLLIPKAYNNLLLIIYTGLLILFSSFN